MGFKGWPVEAIEFYEGLESDNSKTYWLEHKATYESCVKGPMEALVVDLAQEFGPGRLFRPYRDVRFSNDKTPYKLNCSAHVKSGYIAFSAEGLFFGSGLWMPSSDQLKRFRVAIDDDKIGSELESILQTARKGGFEAGAHEVLKTAPKGFDRDHPRIELLRCKGITMSKSWPVGAWLGTSRAKDRVVGALRAAEPLSDWIERHVG